MKRTRIKVTSEKGKPIKANAKMIFQIFLPFSLSTGKSAEILQNQSLSIIHLHIPTGSSGTTPTDEDYRSGEGIF